MERFLLPTPDYPPKRGGVARYLSALVSTFPNAITPLVWKAFPSYREMFIEFWQRRNQFDVLLTSHVLPIGSAALAFRCIARKPYEVMLHGLDFDSARSVPRKRFMMWLVLFFARRVFANSQSLADEVAKFSRRQCLVMYPCVTDELIESADIVSASEEACTRAISLRLLTVGRLVERKGHLKVLETMKQIPNTMYSIVGDGPMKKEILDTIVEMGLQDRVTLLPHVSDGKLPDVYASHDIFVMPSTKSKSDREGFGIVAIEASLFGLPVIATNQPGVDEAVIDGETGILIEDSIDALVAAIMKLSTDPALRERLGRTGRERVIKEFTRAKTMGVFDDAETFSTTPYTQLTTPLVSVYIATYQHARTLGKCIDSILAQSYKPIEIIVVDDGSTDNTTEVLQRFDKKIRVIRQENAGANPARNRGFSETTGEFVICCDADVIMKSRMIEEAVRVLQRHPEASYAYGGFKFGWKVFRDVPFSAERLRKMNFVHTTTLVRRKDFPGFDPPVKRFQDWDVWLTMLEQGKAGILVPGVWCDVLVDGESRIGSSWLPSFVYRLPWKCVGWIPTRVKKYNDARESIVKKHRL